MKFDNPDQKMCPICLKSDLSIFVISDVYCITEPRYNETVIERMSIRSRVIRYIVVLLYYDKLNVRLKRMIRSDAFFLPCRIDCMTWHTHASTGRTVLKPLNDAVGLKSMGAVG